MKQLPISVSSGFFIKYTPEEMIDYNVDHGYTVSEFASGFLKHLQEEYAGSREKLMNRVKEIRKYADAKGFSFPQGHLRFQIGLTEPGVVDILKENIEMSQILGVKRMVLHLMGRDGQPYEEAMAEYYEKQQAAVAELLPCLSKGEYFCLENIMSCANASTIDRLMHFIHDAGDDERLAITLDTGHLNRAVGLGVCNDSFHYFIETAGDRLKALHINGNDGKGDDQHLFPFSMKGQQIIDWKEFMTALSESNYDGIFNYEVPGEYNTGAPLEVLLMKLDYAKKLAEYMMSEEYLNS